MRPLSCHHTEPEARYRRRLHYCGTCKAIGKEYGQKYRFLLSHDTVFLAEILSIWTGEDGSLAAWDAALQSRNCFRIPEQVPFSLEYAATATLLLTDFKFLDQIEDSSGGWWRRLYKWCSPEFRAASAKLRGWGFPVEELRAILGSQQERERRAWTTGDSPEARMGVFAEPTARATALVFRHGARLASRSEQPAEEMGAAFGTFVYIIDALEDYSKDAKRGEFNAIAACLGLSGVELGAASRKWAVEMARQSCEEMIAAMAKLGLAEDLEAEFRSRLYAAFRRKTGVSLRILPETGCRSRSDYWKRFARAVLFPWRADARDAFLG